MSEKRPRLAPIPCAPRRQSMTLSDSVREKPPEELYGIILAKDNRIYELSDKLSELEATVVDLKVTCAAVTVVVLIFVLCET